VMHKNKLQEYLQKSGFPYPVYRTDNEGFAHAPKFRSTVVVNGREFKSRLTYSHRKEPEQDAAELALKIIIYDTNNIEECTVFTPCFGDFGRRLFDETVTVDNLDLDQIFYIFIDINV
ncbi:hypothetical protein S245_052955, partial [Arachis hypogaea]